jgi:hypothetical protein
MVPKWVPWWGFAWTTKNNVSKKCFKCFKYFEANLMDCNQPKGGWVRSLREKSLICNLWQMLKIIILSIFLHEKKKRSINVKWENIVFFNEGKICQQSLDIVIAKAHEKFDNNNNNVRNTTSRGGGGGAPRQLQMSWVGPQPPSKGEVYEHKQTIQTPPPPLPPPKTHHWHCWLPNGKILKNQRTL